MDQQARDATTFLLGTFITLCVIVGLAVRYVLVPYLREHLIAPVQETHKQVTENHHQSPASPTLPDRIEDLATDVRALTRVMDEHLRWSDRWTGLFERRLEVIENGDEHGKDSTTGPTV